MRGAWRLRLQSFADDRRGAVAIMVASSMFVLVGATALAVDVGSFYLARRQAQGAVDLAAIAAARDVDNADAAASAAMHDNGVTEVDELELAFGRYEPDPATAADQRFVADAVPVNAVRVTAVSRTPVYFAQAMGLPPSIQIRTSAIAAVSELASLAIGSRLASLNGGILNSMLSRMLGTTINLSLADYRALADAHVDLLDFADALAGEAQLSVATYESLANATVKLTDVVDALVSVSKPSSGSTTALTTALNALNRGVGSTLEVSLQKVIDFGPYGSLALGQAGGATASASVLDLVNAVAAVSNGTRQIALDLGAAIPGLAKLKLWVAFGERPNHSAWLRVGDDDSTVYTAQARLYLTADITVAGIAGLASINLPLVVEAASGEARLNDIDCSNPASPSVEVLARSGVARAWLGQIPLDALGDFTRPLSPTAATLANVLLVVKITGYADAYLGSPDPESLTFDADDITDRAPQTVSSSNMTRALTSSLFSTVALDVRLLGLGLNTTTVTKAVKAALAPLAPVLDGIIDSTLATLGVGVGQADVWVTGARCDGSVLVQ